MGFGNNVNGTLSPKEFDGTTINSLRIDFGGNSDLVLRGSTKSNNVRITNVDTGQSTIVTHTSHHSSGYYTADPPGLWEYESSGTHTYHLKLEWV